MLLHCTLSLSLCTVSLQSVHCEISYIISIVIMHDDGLLFLKTQNQTVRERNEKLSMLESEKVVKGEIG